MDRLEYTSRELATVYETGNIIANSFTIRAMTSAVLDELKLAIPAATDGAIYLHNEFNNDFDPAPRAPLLRRYRKMSRPLRRYRTVLRNSAIPVR